MQPMGFTCSAQTHICIGRTALLGGQRSVYLLSVRLDRLVCSKSHMPVCVGHSGVQAATAYKNCYMTPSHFKKRSIHTHKL